MRQVWPGRAGASPVPAFPSGSQRPQKPLCPRPSHRQQPGARDVLGRDEPGLRPRRWTYGRRRAGPPATPEVLERDEPGRDQRPGCTGARRASPRPRRTRCRRLPEDFATGGPRTSTPLPGRCFRSSGSLARSSRIESCRGRRTDGRLTRMRVLEPGTGRIIQHCRPAGAPPLRCGAMTNAAWRRRDRRCAAVASIAGPACRAYGEWVGGVEQGGRGK